MIGNLILRNANLRNSLFRKSLRHFSSDSENAFLSFDKFVSRRRNEAKRSLLVEVASIKSGNDLYQVCSEFGPIKKMFHFKRKIGNQSKDVILVEYEDSQHLQKALESARFSSSSGSAIPAQSPVVWLAAKDHQKTSRHSDHLGDLDTSVPLIVIPGNENDDLLSSLQQCKTISEQIKVLYTKQKMTDTDWRLRFFTCRQVEAALSGLFPTATVLPFGSSINSFGNKDCDLDMILEFADLDIRKSSNSSRLVFQSKQPRNTANPRITLQSHMEVVADLLENFVPGCSQVRKILMARVPIIKYFHLMTGLECDLSMNNRSGFYMSELLYLYGCMDPRVRPLVFTIRNWAKDRRLTSDQAGRWITNFSLTQLVLFYLTQTSPPVIPPLQSLINFAGPSDRRETSGIDCTFLRDLTVLTASENEDSLETLLNGFFQFYDEFNFKERGLSLLTGNDFVKPEPKALYIQNPLERDLNVSRNVTFEELDHLKTEITSARYLLEAAGSVKDRQFSRGILSLFDGHISSHPVTLKFGNVQIDWENVFIDDSGMAKGRQDFDVPPRVKEPVSNTKVQSSKNKISEKNNTSKKHNGHTQKKLEIQEVVKNLEVKMKNNKKNRKTNKMKGQHNEKVMYKW